MPLAVDFDIASQNTPSASQALRALVDPANLLTVVRLPMAALVWLRPGERDYLVALLVLAASTDVIDGRVARAIRRRRGSTSRFSDAEKFGAWLDPVCDKLFVISAVVAAFVGFEAPLAVALLTTTREIVLAPLAIIYYSVPSLRKALHLDFHSDWLGKLTTVLQFAVVVALLFAPQITLWLAVLTAILGLVAAIHYLRRGILAARYEQKNPIAKGVLQHRGV